MRSFHIDGQSIGALAGTAYFLSYALMQIPVGLLLDLIGPRKALVGASLVCGIGCLLFGATDSFSHLILARLFIGFGSAFAAISCLKIISTWFPFKQFTVMVGMTVTIGMLGAVTGQGPLAFLVKIFGWREVMMILAAIGGLLALVIFKVVQDRPEGDKEHSEKPHEIPTFASLMKGLLIVIKNPQCWLIAFYGGLMFAPTILLGGVWGAAFIGSSYHLDQTSSGNYISFLFIGWIFGGPLFGMLSDKMGKRKPNMWVGSAGALIALILFIYVKLPLFMLALILFLLGFLSGGFLASFSTIFEINRRSESATSLGFMNTMNQISPIFLGPFIGYLLDLNWNGTLVDHARVYTLENYRMALGILPACVIVAMIFLPFVRETYCRRVVD